MATEADGEEETAGKLSGTQNLAVDDDLREMAKKAAWSVSSCKPGNGVPSLRDDNLETYWQSDGAQPHLVNIQFQKKVKLQLLGIYVDYKLDESYTPSKISIRAGDGFHNMKEIKTVELVNPIGWVHVPLSGSDPRDAFIHTFMLQIAVLSNHLNGRDTHIRQIKIYGPRPNPVPNQPFHFTSKEFITYSTIRSTARDISSTPIFSVQATASSSPTSLPPLLPHVSVSVQPLSSPSTRFLPLLQLPYHRCCPNCPC